MQDEAYMRMALELAGRGAGWVSPNPMVGAVLVRNGQVIGRGWHQRCGQAHAERNALADCDGSPAGATLYVTLEPCCHQGRTPPCTDAILQSGIRRVVVGSTDPNPLVAGRGIALLRQHGVQVDEHVLEAECDRLNEVFFHYIRTKTPFVVLKYAMTMDGKIATGTGLSKWITGEAARRRVHEDRHRYSAILVGVGTVVTDDPQLTCRMEGGRNPLRVICDTHLRTPPAAQVVATAAAVPTVLATCCADPARHAPYLEAGCRILPLPARNGHVDLRALMAALGRQEIDSVLLEGGAALHWSALRAGIVRRVQAYIAPKLFGGRTAPSPVGGAGVDTPDAAIRLRGSVVTRLGEDFLIESEVEPDVHRPD